MGSRAGLLALAVVLALVGGIAYWLTSDEPSAVDADPVVRPAPVERPAAADPERVEDVPDRLPSPVDDVEPVPFAAPDLIVDPDLLEGATVYGLVTYSDGTPAPDVDVSLFDHLGEFYDSIFSDDDGSYVLEAGDALAPGWAVMTESPDYEETDKLHALGPTVHRHPAGHAPGDPPVRVDLEIVPAPRINGRVLDAVSGEAIELAEISVVSTKPGWIDEWQDQFTDEGGWYEMSITNLPPDGLLIWCWGDDQQPGAVGPLDLEPGRTYTFDFRLPLQRELTGTVLDARTRDPVDGADVMALPLHPEYEDPDAWDSTFEDGTFELAPSETPFDKLWLYVLHDDYAPRVIAPPADGWGDDVVVELQPAQTLTGRVVSAAGRRPIDGAYVSVMLKSVTGLLFEDEYDEELTDDDGAFELPLAAVPVSQGVVVVTADGFYPFRAEFDELVGDETGWTERDVTIVLEPLPGE